ncbi:MAG: threonine--tRNA ligase, partial [Chloroflexi bacterium]|nr:threonine--tRNA ligase [Chloroflexota bacterium]
MSMRLDPELAELRRRIRHSAAHVMADVVTQMHPEAKLAIGPPTDEGFYYDFLVPEPFKEEELEEIERRMREVIERDHPFQYREYSREEMLAKNADEPLKLEVISEIPEGEPLSTYTHGRFEDLCAGPHVESTGRIPAFKLLSLAAAYWRGDEKRPMLQRIYGTAFETQEALDEYLQQLEEAKRRDHRKIGEDLQLFTFSPEVGRGLPLWLPKGTILREELEDWARKTEREWGYERVVTPHITRSELYYISGHLPYYKEDMYAPIDIEGDEYYLKPMNCPHHHMIYKSRPHSYRELPIRYAEYGTVYRYERSGQLFGLMRTRGFTQND